MSSVFQSSTDTRNNPCSNGESTTGVQEQVLRKAPKERVDTRIAELKASATCVDKKYSEISTRRTNSLADLLRNTRTNDPIANGKTGSPKRKSELQRLCCSFRRSRRMKTTADLAKVSGDESEIKAPVYGSFNAAAMSRITDAKVARSVINLIEADMAKASLLRPMIPQLSADDEVTSTRLSRPTHVIEKNGEIRTHDLMNDWEIGGTQNPWVCPSDRHLQLRAQLKSGWSVRTATARSPTTTKQQQAGVISDAEQEQIRKVLARAEAGRQHEEERIGKMVDRLEKMRTRATGNGVTQCLLCQTEFGLLAAKSYAAMCLDCRKYVCQKNCGVETFDQKRGEPIFLCKICSEYREVMWKKSGAWFYKEMPTFKKPAESPVCNNNISSGYLTSPGMPSSSHVVPTSNSAWLPSSVNSSGYRAGSISTTGTSPLSTAIHGVNAENSSNPMSPNYNGRQRQLPIPPDQQQRLKTTPRPRITPSWVHEKVQSSMSIGSEDEESSSSSIDATEYKPNANATTTNNTAPIPPSRHHHYSRPRELKHGNGGATSSTNSNSASASHLRSNMQRFTLSNRSRITDTDESENDESRRTTPSTSPRHSLATPSSYGGDDLSQNHTTLATNEASDSKSIDSGVVQSDHSMQQLRQQSAFTTGAAAVSPPPSLTTVQIAHNLRNMGNVAAAQWNAAFGPTTVHQAPLRPSMDVGSGLSNSETNQTSSTVPPIPPRATVPVSSVLPSTSNVTTNRRSSNASTSTNNSQPRASNPTSSRESLSAVQPIQSARSRPISTDRNTTPSLQMGSRESLSIAPIENELPVESPTFMSSPEEDTKVIKSLEKRRWSPASRLTAAIGSLHSRSNRPPCVKSNSLQYSMDSAKSPPPPPVIPMTQKTRAHKFRLLSSRLSATVDEHMGDNDVGKEETMPSRTPSPRRPTSASSMLATINETNNNAAQVQSSEMDLPRRPSSAIVLSNASRRSGSKSSSPHLRCFCFPHRSFRGGTLGAIQFNLTYLAEDKQLVIHLIRAKNLKAMDKNGFSDPYVKFHLIPGNAKATKLSSKTIEKTLNPEWNEEMIYYGITEEERLKKTLRVTVLDRDRIGSDFLGETRVALKKLPLGQTKKFNLYLEHAMPAPLEKAEEVERGKILLSICYNIQQGSLFVNIKRCAELLGMDSSGFSDPYCKVSLTPLTSKAHRQRTAIKKRTLNPEFNETLKFIVPFKDLPKKTLEIGVYDHDVARHDDYIGGIVLSTAAKADRGVQWTQCIENPGKTFEYWHRLETD